MPSTHSFAFNEVPAPYYPGGTNWMAWKLEQAGYHFVKAWTDNNLVYLQVGEANVSRNQLLFDVQPVDGKLACNYTSLNVPPMSTRSVTVTGLPGKTVKVRFAGVCFISETQFTLPGNGNYVYSFGACPAGQRVVTPQAFEFYVEDGSCSPVVLSVTFT